MGEEEKRGPEREPDGFLTSGGKGEGAENGKKGKGQKKRAGGKTALLFFWWPEWERKKREGRKGNRTGF